MCLILVLLPLRADVDLEPEEVSGPAAALARRAACESACGRACPRGPKPLVGHQTATAFSKRFTGKEETLSHLLRDFAAKGGFCSATSLQNRFPNAPLHDLTANDNGLGVKFPGPTRHLETEPSGHRARSRLYPVSWTPAAAAGCCALTPGIYRSPGCCSSGPAPARHLQPETLPAAG